jgi:hypothetical protein
MFQIKVVQEKQKTYAKKAPPPKTVPFNRLCEKNMIKLDRPQMTIKYGSCALHAG